MAMTYGQLSLRISAFGSGVLGLFLFFGSIPLVMPPATWKTMTAALMLGEFFPSLIDTPSVGLSYGWLFSIWSMCKAVAGTDTPEYASRFLKYNCWVVGVWPYLLWNVPGKNTFGIIAFVIIFLIQFGLGFFEVVPAAKAKKR